MTFEYQKTFAQDGSNILVNRQFKGFVTTFNSIFPTMRNNGQNARFGPTSFGAVPTQFNTTPPQSHGVPTNLIAAGAYNDQQHLRPFEDENGIWTMRSADLVALRVPGSTRSGRHVPCYIDRDTPLRQILNIYTGDFDAHVNNCFMQVGDRVADVQMTPHQLGLRGGEQGDIDTRFS